MSIPALFVFALLHDRTNRAEEVAGEVSQLSGGRQTFLGPVLAVPYRVPAEPSPEGKPEGRNSDGVLFVFPVEGSAVAGTQSEVRSRSLFKVPVYTADLSFKAHFDLTGATDFVPPNATVDWSRAELVVGAADAKGAKSDIVIDAGGVRSLAVPAATVSQVQLENSDGPRGVRFPPTAEAGQLRLFGAPAPFATPNSRFDAAATMKFTGAQRLAVLPFAKTTTFDAKGTWASPSFDGGFLPLTRSVTDKGFSAHWAVPFVARGVPAGGTSDAVASLGATALGISFVEPANPYQSVARSLKYALMFVGLVFLAYFLFETMARRRVHPAQYVLIGLAQIIFYLLLLSIAEQVGFDLAFLISAAATVGLISAYAGWVFESRKQGFIALVAFSLLYALIYILMRLEDFALLVGAVTSFAAIAAVMYFTRGIDWYGVTSGDLPATSEERV
jgi:inner membrane protein